MRGLNAAFIASVPVFLAAASLRVQSRHDMPSPFTNLPAHNVPPVFDFDLQAFPPGVQLIRFVNHAKTHWFGTQRRITAYWLDYEQNDDKICDLNNHANYLFTPILNGCYIGFRNGRICHCAGNDDNNVSRGNTVAMRGFATVALGMAPTIGFDSQHADAPEVTVVGVCTAGTWSWYAQGHDPFLMGHGALQPIFDANNNNVPAVYRGQTVIRLVDMTLG